MCALEPPAVNPQRHTDATDLAVRRRWLDELCPSKAIAGDYGLGGRMQACKTCSMRFGVAAPRGGLYRRPPKRVDVAPRMSPAASERREYLYRPKAGYQKRMRGVPVA